MAWRQKEPGHQQQRYWSLVALSIMRHGSYHFKYIAHCVTYLLLCQLPSLPESHVIINLNGLMYKDVAPFTNWSTGILFQRNIPSLIKILFLFIYVVFVGYHMLVVYSYVYGILYLQLSRLLFLCLYYTPNIPNVIIFKVSITIISSMG